jgi:hypothetical protein
VPVTDEQTEALRAFMSFDPSSERLTRDLAGSGRLDGFGALAHAAFVIAVRRRFAPSWTSAQVVGFTAQLRNALRPRGIDLDPKAAEILIRQALGDPVTSEHDDKTQARATTLILIALVADEQLDDNGLDLFMAEARALADARLAARHDAGLGKAKQFGPAYTRIPGAGQRED